MRRLPPPFAVPCRAVPCPRYFSERGTYFVDWLTMAAGYTLQRSLAPAKPVYNTEWHGGSTMAWRDEAMTRQYIETAVWVGLYHGEAMNVAWYWPRGGAAGVEPQAAGKFSVSFAGSFGTEPTAVDAFLRQFMTATVHGGTVAAVGRLAPRVWLLRSWSSLALNSDSFDALLGTFEAASFLGLPVGILIEDPARLAALDGSDDVVLVPGSTHAEEATVTWLRARAAARDTAVNKKRRSAGNALWFRSLIHTRAHTRHGVHRACRWGERNRIERLP